MHKFWLCCDREIVQALKCMSESSQYPIVSLALHAGLIDRELPTGTPQLSELHLGGPQNKNKQKSML